MIFNYFLLVLLFFQYESVDNQLISKSSSTISNKQLIVYEPVNNQLSIPLVPKSSSTILNKQLVIYEPDFFSGDFFSGETSFHTYPILSGDLHFLEEGENLIYEKNPKDEQYDYEFLNAPGSIQSKDKVYMIGSLRFKYRSLADASLAKRFSILELNKSGYKKSKYWNMTEPPFDHFPHFDYSSTLVGDIGANHSLLNTHLYILGGAKYFPSTNTTKIITSFCRYNFRSNQWEDLTHLLPLNNFKPFAGHQVLNIENKKLIVLGGYRTNEYYDNYSLPYGQAEFIDLKKIWIFDILNQKWERQTTFYEGDDQRLPRMRHHTFPVTYRNNKIYVMGGKFRNNRYDYDDCLFGILDLTNWHWNWKWIGSSQTCSHPSTYKTTLLVENYMLITYEMCFVYYLLNTMKVIDLENEKFVRQVKFPKSIALGEKYYDQRTWEDHFRSCLFLVGSLVLIIMLILFMLYKLKRRTITRFITDKEN